MKIKDIYRVHKTTNFHQPTSCPRLVNYSSRVFVVNFLKLTKMIVPFKIIFVQIITTVWGTIFNMYQQAKVQDIKSEIRLVKCLCETHIYIWWKLVSCTHFNILLTILLLLSMSTQINYYKIIIIIFSNSISKIINIKRCCHKNFLRWIEFWNKNMSEASTYSIVFDTNLIFMKFSVPFSWNVSIKKQYFNKKIYEIKKFLMS